MSQEAYKKLINDTKNLLKGVRMAKKEWKKTRFPGIYQYEINSGVRYGVRVPYRKNDGKLSEVSKSGFKTLNEAKSKKREYEEDIKSGKTQKIDSRKITLDEWFVKYLEIQDFKKGSSTETSVKGIYKRIWQPEFGRRTLENLDRVSYQIFINELLQKKTKLGTPYRVATVRNAHKRLMAILNEAERCDVIVKNKLTNTKIAKEEEPNKKSLEKEEYDTFMQTAEKMLNNEFLCMTRLLSWGLRRGEVLGITLDCVEFTDRNTVVINIRVTRTDGANEGKKTKTKSSERIIELNGQVVELLRTSIKNAREIYFKNGKTLKNDSFIFVTERARPLHLQKINKELTRVSEQCGIKVTPHILRHAFITLITLAGGSVVDISKFVGHSNITITQQVYTHSTEDGTRKMKEIAGRILN
jgi:integrase